MCDVVGGWNLLKWTAMQKPKLFAKHYKEVHPDWKTVSLPKWIPAVHWRDEELAWLVKIIDELEASYMLYYTRLCHTDGNNYRIGVQNTEQT